MIQKILKMGKVRKEKEGEKCYQSASGARPPRCRTASDSLCGPCTAALAHYNQAEAARQEARRLRNRRSAHTSRMRKEDRYSDLLSDNLALNAEYDELVQELDAVNAANEAEAEAISAKVQEILAMAFNSGT